MVLAKRECEKTEESVLALFFPRQKEIPRDKGSQTSRAGLTDVFVRVTSKRQWDLLLTPDVNLSLDEHVFIL
jgi:hypothetical protein